MPKVGKKKYPYTNAGKKAAEDAKKKQDRTAVMRKRKKG
jgi:hypothetical protein